MKRLNCRYRFFILIMAAALVLSGCGQAAVSGQSACEVPENTEVEALPEASAVEVSTVDELLAAIAPGAEIRMAAGVYDLTQASDYGKPLTGGRYTWESLGYEDECQLVIRNVDGLTVTGEKGVEIVTQPRSANVLTFESCNNLCLEGLTFGHTEAAEACDAGVICLDVCSKVTIQDCSLYGCGTIGVSTDYSNNVSIIDCDIYDCSSGAVDFMDGSGLSVSGCSIYRIGNTDTGTSAFSVFTFSSGNNISVKSCDISSCYSAYLVFGSASNIEMDGLRVHDNNLDAVFNSDTFLSVTNLVFTGNSVGSFYSEFYSAYGLCSCISLDGTEADESYLRSLYGEQMVSAGLADVDVEAKAVDLSRTKEVYVSSADEFVAALSSDTTVVITVPQIDLSEAEGFKACSPDDYWYEEEPDFSENAVCWNAVYDGAQLCIGGLENLHIVSECETCEIVTEPRYANVLSFYDCSGISIDGITVGHTKGDGECTGGVLYFSGCSDVIIERCDLYGCGIYGISTDGGSEIYVQNTSIHDCSCGAALCCGTESMHFINCTVNNCPTYNVSVQGCEDFTFNGKLMAEYCAFDVQNDTIVDGAIPVG